MKNPSWWNDKHDSTWGRVKSALKRDWEQTKADWSKAGHELNQGVGDTVKQAAGKEPIPAGNTPNPDWDHVELGYRYGTGARTEYGGGKWDDKVESKLAAEWTSLEHEHKWEDVKPNVRRAWEYDEGPRK